MTARQLDGLGLSVLVAQDAENEVLVGGDFMMAGFVIGSDNVDNQTVSVYTDPRRYSAPWQAAWGFAHFNGANWRPGWNGLRCDGVVWCGG